jgi:hypothetical protein
VDADHTAQNEAFSFHWTDAAVQIWIGALVFALVGAYLVDRYLRQPPQVIIDKGAQWHRGIVYLFRLIVGISLILTAYRGAILAPHLKEGTTFALALRGVEALIGVLFIANRLVFIGAVLLFLLFFASMAMFGFLMSVSINLLGIASSCFYQSPQTLMAGPSLYGRCRCCAFCGRGVRFGLLRAIYRVVWLS